MINLLIIFVVFTTAGIVAEVASNTWSTLRMYWRFAGAQRRGQIEAAQRRHPAGSRL